jgi:hypothetical protein
MGSSALTQPEYDICVQRIAWDLLFFDPHAAEADFSDAGYLGIVTASRLSVPLDFVLQLAVFFGAKHKLVCRS